MSIMSTEPTPSRPRDADPEGSSASASGDAAADAARREAITIVHDDVAVVVGPDEDVVAPERTWWAIRTLPEPGDEGFIPETAEQLRVLSERLRRLEEELDGVFEMIGRMLRETDAQSADGRESSSGRDG